MPHASATRPATRGPQPPACPLRAGEDGQSLVELALTLPVLLLVVTGILSFGLALNNYVMLTDATSIGARALAVSRAHTTDPCQVVSGAAYAAAPSLKQNFGFKVQMNGNTYTGPSCPSASTTSGSAADLVAGQQVQVNVTYPCSLMIYRFIAAGTSGGCTMTAQTTELIQ